MFIKQKRNLMLFILMLFLVPLAGELKLHPFGGCFAAFQVSLGSPVFLLFILLIHKISLTVIGVCTGISVVIFRALLDNFCFGIEIKNAFLTHAATFFYYFVYAGCFIFVRFDKKCLYNKSLQIVICSIFAEISASITELTVVCFLFHHSIFIITFKILLKIMLIAILRCLFILSFFFLAQIYVMESKMHQEHKERERILLLITDIYNEVIQLNKSQENAETITRDCYKVYEQLHRDATNSREKAMAQKVLSIAGAMHEMKKDNQRIYAGFVTLMDNRSNKLDNYMSAESIGQFAIDIHQRYAKALGKTIDFSLKTSPSMPSFHVYTILSLVNNLISNAVEAINKKGTIKLLLMNKNDMLYICVINTGSFITTEKLDLVFQAGYTTKFDINGAASAGVGLSYVKSHAERLGGTATISSNGINTVKCAIYIPINKLKKDDLLCGSC
ncbi:sensor histidine kinase [Pectinatus sottacetonis]|uniref:sensor histidine kinase n=1 Tax=Pectinatus sottacetonis TaxID=1002795 RepID=UPI0018C74639|nr:sensor histidine kinase [Pectinatus sottacetonis]